MSWGRVRCNKGCRLSLCVGRISFLSTRLRGKRQQKNARVRCATFFVSSLLKTPVKMDTALTSLPSVHSAAQVGAPPSTVSKTRRDAEKAFAGWLELLKVLMDAGLVNSGRVFIPWPEGHQSSGVQGRSASCCSCT